MTKCAPDFNVPARRRGRSRAAAPIGWTAVLLALLLAAAGAGMLRSERSYNHTGYGGSRLLVDPDAELVVAFYMVEHGENDDCKNNSRAANVLYSALD